MSERRLYPPPIHFLAREEGRLGFIACNVRVMKPSQYTDDPSRVSCHSCARHAPGLTVPQRIEIWALADERLGKFTRCPWSAPIDDERRQEAINTAPAEERPFGMPKNVMPF